MFAHRVYEATHDGDVPFWMMLNHALALSSVGVVTFLVFGCTKDNFTLWREWLMCRAVKRRGYHKINDAKQEEYTMSK